ncbi:MAG: anti-sigma factor family protein [Armatimonadota bacterium]
MKAAHVAEYYTAYLEGSLPEELRQEVARHLEACPQCAAELEEMRLLVESLREMPELPAPVNFAAGVRARLDARRPPRPWFLRVPVLAGGTLAATALVLAIVFAPMLQSPRGMMVAKQPERALEKNWQDTPDAAMELQTRGLSSEKSEAITTPPPAAPVPDPFALDNGGKPAQTAPTTATPPPVIPHRLGGNDARGKVSGQPTGRLSKGGGAGVLLDRKDGHEMPADAAADEQRPPVIAMESSAKPESKTDEPAPAMMAKLPPVAAEAGERERTPPPAAMPSKAAGPAGPQGPSGPATSAATGNARNSSADAPGFGSAQSSEKMAVADSSLSEADREYLDPDGGVRLQYAVSNALVLRSAVVKGAEATVTVETAAPAPTGLLLRPIEPTRGKARSYPLSAEARTSTFTLPLQRGGSVVELIVNAGNTTTRAYLAVPDTGARKASFSLNLRKAPMTEALQRLAVAGSFFILCPAELAEKKDVTFTAHRAKPFPALVDLAFEHSHQAVISDNLAILVPKEKAP